ncbi:C-terminal binding protein [Cohnella ginsengisoli]|uniref:C-terminal binding protein n=1 Tax=Cohnella ginsengisoli TaxID=425004 RepID=A0A9X4KKU6_9BACL|nr:C-terminal binding protein [Cohnella ginsengisoli]MDG0793888.1 C-terminal binding protein [Cohnella ginsengisoli]
MRKLAIWGAGIFGDRRERELFEPAGYQADYYEGDDPLALAAALTDVEGLIVNLEQVSDELLDRLPFLKVIGRYGVGVDNIDLEAASRRRIAVINVPDYCVDEVAEHAVSFIFAANRKLQIASSLPRQGDWGKVQALKPIRAIKETTLGVVGTGRIGMKVIEMMAPFGCKILICDPYLAHAHLPKNAEMTGFDQLLARSDIITIHCPLTAQTRRMFRAETFARMRKQPAIVNVSRGPIVDERDLLVALDEGIVSFAALDVMETEPPERNHPLLHHPMALVTGHAAWYSEQSENRLRDFLAVRMMDYLEGRPVPSIVNKF